MERRKRKIKESVTFLISYTIIYVNAFVINSTYLGQLVVIVYKRKNHVEINKSNSKSKYRKMEK
jgi:hypothetical protein